LQGASGFGASLSTIFLLLLGRQWKAAKWADMADPEPVEDALLMEGVRVGHRPVVAPLKVFQAHAATTSLR